MEQSGNVRSTLKTIYSNKKSSVVKVVRVVTKFEFIFSYVLIITISSQIFFYFSQTILFLSDQPNILYRDGARVSYTSCIY